MLALWLAGVALFTGMSWLAVMDETGRFTLRAAPWQNKATWRSWTSERAGRRVRRAQQMLKVEIQKSRERSPLRIEPVIAAVEKSERVERERQVPLFEKSRANELPPLSLLNDPPPKSGGYSEEALEALSRQVELKLQDFGVEAEVVAVYPGPVVTRFELQPAPGTKVSKISGLVKGPGAVLVGDQRAGSGSDSGQIGDRSGVAERES